MSVYYLFSMCSMFFAHATCRDPCVWSIMPVWAANMLDRCLGLTPSVLCSYHHLWHAVKHRYPSVTCVRVNVQWRGSCEHTILTGERQELAKMSYPRRAQLSITVITCCVCMRKCSIFTNHCDVITAAWMAWPFSYVGKHDFPSLLWEFWEMGQEEPKTLS